MAIGGKPAARAMRTKGVGGKGLPSSSASTKTKNAFKKMSSTRGGFKK
jgi:hypothetical protein